MQEKIKPAAEVIGGLRSETVSTTTTNEQIIGAQEKFPGSKLVAQISSLNAADIEMLDYACNIIGCDFSSFGMYEKDADADEIENAISLIATFAQETSYDKKRMLAKQIATLVD